MWTEPRKGGNTRSADKTKQAQGPNPLKLIMIMNLLLLHFLYLLPTEGKRVESGESITMKNFFVFMVSLTLTN